MKEKAIEIHDLTKDYGSGRGVFDINFDIYKGEMLGFVGSNGAGKTTTIRNIMGFLKPDKGNVTVYGMDSWQDAEKTKKYIGYVPGEIAFPDLKTGTEFIKSQAEFLGLKDMSYANFLIEKLQLEPSANLKRMSKGMKQKTALVAALMNDAPVIILDEPTAALDPIAEADMYSKYNAMAEGRSSVYISHRLASTRFCDRIILLDGSVIAEEGTHDELMALGGKYKEFFDVQSKYYKDGGKENEEEN